MLSIVVPLYNESETILALYQAVVDALDGFPRPFELILVNDGSTDDSAEKLGDLAGQDERVKIITFAGNFGQTAAMMAGFRAAAGDIIVPMDGDLQNDPADIPMLVEKLDEGFDVVSGWRKDRQDHTIRRNLPSRIGNALISKVSGVSLHDHGCTLKAFRADVLRGVRLYGEMHRFISVYASWQGARVIEVPVRHHARRHGQSNYGLGRIIKVLLDLLVVKFLGNYRQLYDKADLPVRHGGVPVHRAVHSVGPVRRLSKVFRGHQLHTNAAAVVIDLRLPDGHRLHPDGPVGGTDGAHLFRGPG